MQVQLVIFDMDGLMFDTERLSIKGWQHAGRELGFHAGEQVLEELIGRDVAAAQQILTAHVGENFPFEQARRMRDQYVLDYAREHGTPKMPGLEELVSFLEKRNIRRVVATSTEIGRGQKLLEYAGMLNRFDDIVYGNMVERGKPHPDIFLKAAELFGAEPGRCLVLEDSNAGVEAAWRAGMPVYMICDLKQPDEDAAQHLTRRLGTLHDVIPLLGQ